jgi:hypothetical protein
MGWTPTWHIIGGGGLVFEPVGIWDNTTKGTQKKTRRIGVAGLGINRMDESLANTVRTIAERSEFFYVRDQRSLDLCVEAPNQGFDGYGHDLVGTVRRSEFI